MLAFAANKNHMFLTSSDSDSRCSLACDASARDAKSLAIQVDASQYKVSKGFLQSEVLGEVYVLEVGRWGEVF